MRRYQGGFVLLSGRFLPAFLLLFIFSPVFTQTFNNSWIDYNQKYFRIPVPRDGLYRITYQKLNSTLQAFGVQPENIPVDNFQVWSCGQQLHLYINAGTDGVFSPGDYIDFYAKKNDGWLDSNMYEHPNQQINRSYSLFNDTAHCYFSWNAAGNNPRMSYDTLTGFTSYNPAPYVCFTRNYVFHETYLEGERYNTADPDVTVGDAHYTGGEGYSGNKIWVNLSQARNITLESIYNQGPPANIEFTLVGGSNRQLVVNQHHVSVDLNTVTILDTSWACNVPVSFSKNVPLTHFSGGMASLVFKNIEIPGQILQEWASVSNISVTYPRTLDFTGAAESWFLLPEIVSPDYTCLKISGIANTAGDSLRLFDLRNHRMIKTLWDGGFYKALVKNFPGQEECYFTLESNASVIQKIEAVDPVTASFVPYHSQQFFGETDYLILTSSKLRPAADIYAQYRQLNGHPVTFTPMVVNVEQLYDQYAFGIPKHPIAIRNFLMCVTKLFPQQIQHVFLIGKSFLPKQFRTDPVNYALTEVPAWGSPPSDVMFSLGLHNMNEMEVPLGRLSAYAPENVLDYLSKVQAFEFARQVPDPSFKNVIQFGGGSGFLEQIIFRNYLLEYDSLLTAPFIGARTFNFFKNSPEPVEVNQSEYLRDLIENKGISLMNFFGHASGISFDMGPGDPELYENQGNYYFVTANSCWAGDIFNYHGGLSSEHYVLLPGKGAIGYLASVTEGETPYLHAYMKRFLSQLASQNYGQSVGKSVSATLKSILKDTLLSAFGYRETSYEMTLHGDPALILNPFYFPDFDLSPSADIPEKLVFSPEEVTTEIDSFQFIILHSNNGKALDTSYFVRVQRTIEGATLADTLVRVRAPYSLDTLRLVFPVDKFIAAGLNTFRVTLDAFQEFDENNREFNNTWETDLIIQSNEIYPVLPPEFAVVPDKNVSLIASTSFPFITDHTYVFQVDTNAAFTSPVMLRKELTQSGGVVQWDLNLPLSQDSLVYFWRCGLKTPDPDSVNWKSSSFQYVEGKTGWSQAHFLQMEHNSYEYVKYLKDSLKWVFAQDMKTLVAQTFIKNHPWQEENYKINNRVMDIWSCAHTGCNGSTGMKIAVFNPVSFEPWFSYDTLNGIGPWGNRHCKAYPTPSFDFCNNDSVNRSLISRFIDTIPDGYYVMAMSHISPKTQQYEESLYQAFESIGSASIRQIADTSSFIIFGRKGSLPGQADETGLNSSGDSLLNLTVNIETKWNQGKISSSLIGPASSWHSIHWRTISEPTDSAGFIVLGIRYNGDTDTLLQDLPADSNDITQLEQLIPAKIYPFLQLIMITRDKSMNPSAPPTPVILKRWQVFYEGLPETAIDPASAYYFYQENLSEGDSLRLYLAYHNISELNMDSLLVKYSLKNSLGNEEVFYQRFRQHPAHDIITDTVILSTLGKAGSNKLRIEVNPGNDQPELLHSNNIGEIAFSVMEDNIPPLLDVTFDGIHIMDYDYVSDKVKIEIRLSDDNKYLSLNDTSLIRVWLKYEDGTETPIYFHVPGSDQMVFSPALIHDNSCRVTYYPHLLKEGVYSLRVKAMDKSENLSVSEDYNIHFTVLFASLNTSVIAIPNPFRDYTRFAFVISGSCFPDDITITISDVTGNIVRIFTRDEFGPLHIGTNLADHIWDGRDNHGNFLSNGVYFYKANFSYPCEMPGSLPDYQGKFYHFSSTSNGKIVLIR
ncbi:MAG: C25 family cysteine peptidase [Bacteroidales bacterium]